MSRRDRDRELNEELQGHLDMAIAERMRRGETAKEATSAARREFGNMGLVYEVARENQGGMWLERLRQDLRYGVRALRRVPGFSIIALLCLSLGIGANAAVFSWMEGVVLRPYPGVADQERLVVVVGTAKSQPGYDGLSWPDLKDLERTTTSFSSFIVAKITTASVISGDRAQRLVGQLVSANYLDALGVRPVLGRGFVPGEDVGRDAHPVVLISYALWQDRFGGERDVIGKTITFYGVPHTIVGVTPREFLGTFVGYAMQFWVPVSQQGVFDDYKVDDRTQRWVEGFARLKPGVRLEQGRADIAAAGARLAAEYPKEDRGRGVQVLPLSKAPFDYVKTVLPMLRVASVVAIFVLIIACANVANLLLVRALARRHEMTVRMAVGAGRLRLVRQLLTEGAILAAFATALGVLLAFSSRNALALFFAPRGGVKLVFASSFDWRVVGATVAVGVLATIVFAVVPAIQTSSVDLAGALKSESRGNLGAGRRGGLRMGLVAAQVCLSFVLLVGSALILEGLGRLQRQQPGFATEGVITTSVNLLAAGYDTARAHRFDDVLQSQVASLPGVESVAIAQSAPLSTRPYDSAPIEPEGYVAARDEQPTAEYNAVTPGYFATLGIRLVAGRDFTVVDSDTAPAVAIVSKALVTRYFPGVDPIGRHLRLGGRSLQIIGVAADIKYRSLLDLPQPVFYIPLRQHFSTATWLFVRTSRGTGLSSALIEAMHSIDANVSPYEIITMATLVSRAAVPQRIAATLVSILSVVALALSAIGLYGVISYIVSQSVRELGLRMALGASPRDLLRLVLSDGVRLTAIGLGFGVGLAFVTTRLLGDLLYRTSPRDPGAFGMATAVMIVASVTACLLPGLRATRIDPVRALRT